MPIDQELRSLCDEASRIHREIIEFSSSDRQRETRQVDLKKVQEKIDELVRERYPGIRVTHTSLLD